MKKPNHFNHFRFLRSSWDILFRKTLTISLLSYLSLTVSTAQTNFRTLNYLYGISGSKCVSGQHNDQKDGTGAATYTERVNTITGKYPGLWSGDFLFSDNTQNRWDITYEAERQWNKGAMINFMWHCCPPTIGSSCGWNPGVIGMLTYSQWTSLLTDGGTVNNTWKSRMDEIAVFLQYLKDKGIEVMFRPLHEQNQSAFWWGGKTEDGAVHPEYTKKLYQLTHDYMVNVKGLTNLIWVWDVQDMSGNFASYNPGSAYFDVAALDIYGDGYSNSSYYNSLVAQAGGKPIGIGECFTLPSTASLQNYPKFCFFMSWAYGLEKDDNGNPTNSISYIQEVYNNPRVVTRDEMPGWSTVPTNLATSKAVTVSSTETGSNIASNATDGNYGTRWSSVYSDPQWIYVDLGANYDINRVKITWETAYAASYLVQISPDAATWATLKTITGNSTLVNDHTGLSGTGRYVRIYGTARATQWGYSIFELEVYGTAAQSPYGGTPWAIPGTIEAENYDIGGEGAAFHDLTPTNNKGQYRPSEAVDIETCSEGGYDLADAQTGEWAEYTVNVTTPGTYNIMARVAAITAGKAFHIELDGQNISGTMSVPNTGGWQNWTTISVTTPVLTAGKKIMRIVMDAADYFNLNWIQFAANLAVNKTASASSVETSGFEAAKAFDGDAVSTRWSSSYADNQWLAVDLGSAYNVSKVVIKWEAAYASSYRIETSTDNTTWAVQKTITNGVGGTEDQSFTAVTARYVRMYGVSRATAYGFSIFEFEVYGINPDPDTQAPTAPTGLTSPAQTSSSISLSWAASTDNVGVAGYDIYNGETYAASTTATSYTIESLAAGTAYTFTVKAKDAAGNYSAASSALTASTLVAATTNLALGQIGAASSLEDTTFPASLAFDGNTATRWASLEGVDPQWIYVDLGATYSITRVKLFWEAAYAKSYKIQVSADASTWADAYSTATGDGATDDISFTAVNGRYVRVYGTARGTSYGYSIYEFEVYGTTAKSINNRNLQPALSIEAYPNPAKNNVAIGIKGANSAAKLKVFSLSGKIAYQSDVVKGEEAVLLNITNWPKGTYVILLENGQEKVLKKIVVE